MKDKRRSRDAIRSLLDLMSENRSMQSVYTMDANHHAGNGYSHNGIGVGVGNNNIVRLIVSVNSFLKKGAFLDTIL